MVHQLHKAQQLHCSLEMAWKFFSSPHNLSRITPGDMKFKVLSQIPENISEGMIIDYIVSPILGIPMQWQTLIAQVDEQKSFTDIQLKGPYQKWKHIHEFIPNDQGVLMKDTVEYELPWSFIGNIVHSLLIKKKLQQIFDFRHVTCDTLFNLQKQSV